MVDNTRLSYRVFGRPGAERLVVLVGTGIAVTVDPLPAETSARDICVMAVALEGAAIEDPGTFGSETPAEQTAAALVGLIRESLESHRADTAAPGTLTAGIVAYREAADVALRAAVALGDTIDRVVLVAVAAPATPLDQDDLAVFIEGVTAKTLIMNGQREELAANAAAAWYQDHLASARIEMIPDADALSLPSVWGRALSHVAPGTKR